MKKIEKNAIFVYYSGKIEAKSTLLVDFLDALC